LQGLAAAQSCRPADFTGCMGGMLEVLAIEIGEVGLELAAERGPGPRSTSGAGTVTPSGSASLNAKSTAAVWKLVETAGPVGRRRGAGSRSSPSRRRPTRRRAEQGRSCVLDDGAGAGSRPLGVGRPASAETHHGLDAVAVGPRCCRARRESCASRGGNCSTSPGPRPDRSRRRPSGY